MAQSTRATCARTLSVATFIIEIHGFIIEIHGFFIQNDGFCIQNDGFCIENGDLNGNIKRTTLVISTLRLMSTI